MSQPYHHSHSPPSTSPQATNESQLKEKSEATSIVFSTETPVGLDFLKMPEDQLFCKPNDTPDEIQGSLERLERLLQPVEDGFDPTLRHYGPLNETAEISPRATPRSANTSTKHDTVEEAPKLNVSLNGHLLRPVETIRKPDFMHLSMQYAFYASDPRFEFERFTGEPMSTVDESSRKMSDGDHIKEPASRSDNNILVERAETQTLIMAEPASTPSEDQITTPKDGDHPTIQQGRCTEMRKQEHNFRISESVTPHSTKRKRNSRDHEPRGSSNDEGRGSLRKAVKRGDTANEMNKVTGLERLSTQFIVYRYGIKPVHDSSRRWQCSFPEHDALPDGKCLASFDSDSIRRHVADHVEAHRKKRPHDTLECPYRKTGKGCTWKETTGPNTGLPRHVAEVHLKSNRHKCACGTCFARGSRDQYVRHLRDGHRTKLEMKRKTDQTTPDFVDIDDPKLVEEEKQWSRGMGRYTEKEEDDRGEGSSKRTRRF
ncbi:hypothetical protein A7U60_g739 [Sanghuangporus baumii]|uniref:Uncharacterized protein n=1 Tax=Sanghuangporus baumii TaxID=108892 RepID=A0A9Q5I5Y0_SANBA|nr:hypothetical protein A7U60_g739 [Sanghuangporus baumii]